MNTVPLSETKARLGALLDQGIVITRNGSAAAVRSDMVLVAGIRRGLTALKRGKARLYTLDTPCDE